MIKTPLVIDVAYNNVTDAYDPIKKKDYIIPPDWNIVNWDLVKGVICKSSQSYLSGTYEDVTFRHNWSELGRLNKSRGAYHFYSTLRSSGKQAKEFIDIVNKYGGVRKHKNDLLILDAESPGMSISALVDFIYNVERLTNIKPILYSRVELLNSLNHRKLTSTQKDYLKSVKIWVAGYPFEPDKFSDPYKAGYIPDQNRYGKVVLWQYDSEVPNIGNIPGGMDVNWIDPEFYEQWIGGVIDIPQPKTEGDKFEEWYKLLDPNVINYFSAKLGWMERSKQ